MSVDAMIDRQQAELIADMHIASLGKPAPGYRFSRGEPVAVGSGPYSECWYFDYIVLCDPDIPEERRDTIYGAIGFVIDNKTGQVSPLAGGDWAELDLPGTSDS